MISQLELVTGIWDLLEAHDIQMESRHHNAVIKAANDILKELNTAHVPAVEGSGLQAWLRSHDTGSSSLYMAHVLCGSPPVRPAHPHDPDDFGRCLRFMLAVGVTHEQLQPMADCSPVWADYVDRWDEMRAIYERDLPTRKSSELYELMQAIQRKHGR